METLETKPEDGSPTLSWENVYKLTQIHGSVVAITHIITPRGDHVTKVFFFEGKSHPAEGFALGAGDEEHFPKVLCMSMLIQSIPGMASNYDEAFSGVLGTDPESIAALKDGRNLVFHFMAPDIVTLPITRESSGMLAFEQSAEFIAEENNLVRIITESKK